MLVLVRFRKLIWWTGLVAACCISLGLVGCETTVDPILETARPFTMYGYFTTGADTQSAVVIPIRGKLDPGDPQAPVDAVVQSEDLMTGAMVSWRDSVVMYDSGTFAHVFWAPFRAEAEHRYNLEVRRSDGAVSSAEVRIPGTPSAVIAEPQVFGTRRVTQKIDWSPIQRVLRTTITYHVIRKGDPGLYSELVD